MPRSREIDDDVVLDAVGKVVERGGPDAVTFARVAEVVGLSQATLVQRFGNKRGLLLATTIRGWNRLVGSFARTRRSHESPTEALLTALIGLTRGVRTRASLANSIAFLHIDLSDPEFQRYAVAGTIAMRERIEALLVEAIAAGELVPTDTKRLAEAVQNAYNGALITWAMTDQGRLQDWLRSQIEFLLMPVRAHARVG